MEHIKSVTWLEELNDLQDIEEEMHKLQNTHCTNDCECFDNGGYCRDDCLVLEILGELNAKAIKKLKAL